MTAKKLLAKFASSYVWGNVVAMLIVLALLCLGVRYGLEHYTHHGESIEVPNLVNMQYDDAEDLLDSLGLQLVVSDTGYIKTLPPDCILEQSPIYGKRVKSGHVIYITINSAGAPTMVIPDVIDNGSWREVRAMMLASGFNVGEPQYMPGERDWIYGILVNGRHVKAGDRVPVDAKIVVQVGDGTRSVADSLSFSNVEIEYEEVEEEPEYEYEWVEVPIEEGDEDYQGTVETPSAPKEPAPSGSAAQ